MIVREVSIFDARGMEVMLLPILTFTESTLIFIARKSWLACLSFFDKESDGVVKVQPILTWKLVDAST